MYKKGTIYMKNKIFKLLATMVCASSFAFAKDCSTEAEACCTGVATSKNTFFDRSFGSSSSREILMSKSMYCSERDEWAGIFSAAFEFSQNFGSGCEDKNLGIMPFWSGTNSMTYGKNDGESNVDAWQFGMGDLDQIGTIKLDPRVQHAGVDMMLQFMQHTDKLGFYFKVKAPMGATMIDPRMSEPTKVAADTANYTFENPDNENTTYPAPDNRPGSLAQAFAGGYFGSSSDDCSSCDDTCSGILDGSFGREVVLEFGKISTCKNTVFRLADLSFSMGAQLLSSEKAVLSAGLKVVAPTGNAPKAVEVLEPIFGRGGYWGVGGELFGHWNFYECDKSGRVLSLRWQGEACHLAHGRTGYRSFDLKQNGKGSKYLLLGHYHQQADGTYAATSLLTQAVNLTTLPVKSSFGVEGSLAVMVDLKNDNWDFGIGGEFWGRSCEKLSVDCCKAIKNHFTGDLNDFAVMGRQQLSTLGGTNDIKNLCEPLATINKSEDAEVASLTTSELADKPKLKNALLAENRIPEKIEDALDIDGARAHRAITGKVFANAGYCWSDSNYKPHLSLFGSAEFTGSDNNALNKWAVGLQGNLTF